MSEDPSTPPPSGDPAQAFEGLRQEVALLHTAILGLTAAREKMPDYSTSLGAIRRELATLRDGVDRIEHAPAVKLTPAAMVRELAKGAHDARADDKRQLDEARAGLHQSIGRLDGLVLRAHATRCHRPRAAQQLACARMDGGADFGGGAGGPG